MANPSIDEVIGFVRNFTGVCESQVVSADTKIEADLGVTGDDGVDLLFAANSQFQVDLASPTHGIANTLDLAPNHFLFGPEGFGTFGVATIIRWLKREARPVYRDLTVRELHKALLVAPSKEGTNAL